MNVNDTIKNSLGQCRLIFVANVHYLEVPEMYLNESSNEPWRSKLAGLRTIAGVSDVGASTKENNLTGEAGEVGRLWQMENKCSMKKLWME